MALTEIQELQLLEKADLRFVLAPDENALEQNLDVFFPAVLLKLGSEHATVRQLVFQIIKNVMGRITSLKSVKLPVAKLVAQSKTGTMESPAISQYSLLFAARGVERMSVPEISALVPEMIVGFSMLPEALKPRMFSIFCKLLLRWDSPQKDSQAEEAVRKVLDVGSIDDKKSLLEKFTTFFFLNPVKVDAQTKSIPRGYSCPGITVSEVEFFTYNAGLSFGKEHLLAYKEAIFRFVVSGFMSDNQYLLKFLIVVSTDSSDLSNHATALLKRLNIPYGNEEFIDQMMDLYTGDAATSRPPVKSDLQEKIISILSHSTCATRNPHKVSVISSIGLNSKKFKLRSAALTFVQHVADRNRLALSTPSLPSDYSANIASLIRNNLHTEGWPQFRLDSSVANFSLSLEQRRKQYETLGIILAQGPSYDNDFSFIEFLIDSLRGDLSTFRTTIHLALNSLSPLLKTLPIQSKQKLKLIARKTLSDNYDLYHGNTDDKDALMHCRAVMIRFINSTFEYGEADSRTLNILGTLRNNRSDVREESIKGLHPYWFKVQYLRNLTTSQSFEQTVDNGAKEILGPPTAQLIDSFNEGFKRSISDATSSFYQTTDQAIKYILKNLISEAVAKDDTTILDENWSLKTENALRMDGAVRQKVKNILIAVDSDILFEFISIIVSELAKGRYMIDEGPSNEDDTLFCSNVVYFVEFAPHSILKKLRFLLPELYNSFTNNGLATIGVVDHICKLYGLIFAASGTHDDLTILVEKLEPSLNPPELMRIMLAASFSVPLCALHGKITNEEQILNYTKLVQHFLDVKELSSVGLKCLKPLLKYGLLHQLTPNTRTETLRQLSDSVKKMNLKNQQSMKAWTYLSLYCDDFSSLIVYLDVLKSFHSLKDLDTNLQIGEAIAVLAGRWNCKLLVFEDYLDEHQVSSMKSRFSDKFSEAILETLLAECQVTKPSMRKAACIWLLCFIQLLVNTKTAQDHAEEIHRCFAVFLADNDDLVQDSASRGLGLIYEISSKEMKDNMLKGLLKAFADPKAEQGMSTLAITADSQLFEPGSMNTGDGSLSTYKDILSLASEAGDPSMVYKFMPLARNSALWSSRKGMAFGLTSIFSQAGLDNISENNALSTKKLIPLLFRYRFDPYRNVADAMNGIWHTLVKNPGQIITQYRIPILDSVLQGMTVKDWRVREASTVALMDLLENTQEGDYSDRLETIWTLAFRVMDDIKESTRAAGLKLTNKLSRTLISSASKNGGQSKSLQNMLEKLIPFFLGPKGLNSDAEEVRSFALGTLTKLVKESSGALQKFAPSLIYEFLLLLSPLEPQEINYLTMNADKYNIDPSAIDTQRVLGIQNAPMMKTIEKLLETCLNEQLPDVIEGVLLASKKSIGLPSKIGSSKAISSLVMLYPNHLYPFSTKLLKACLAGLYDRNSAIATSYAASFGRVCKVCKVERVAKYGKKLVAKFFESNNSTEQEIVGEAFNYMYQYSVEMFHGVGVELLPLTFIAQHNDCEEVSKIFTKLWNEANNSTSGGVNLYMVEIIELAGLHLTSQNFNTKLMCAKSICEICKFATPERSKHIASELFAAVLEASKGRPWEGKDVVIETLITLAIKFKPTFSGMLEQRNQLNDRLATELSRNNREYVQKVLL
ncbi:LADA_0G02960g1_1 [Lachancea dasiensis]|uniref:LADA_0G02960g1_1 n=1 Tax=Lachancea dasiensis TaxID=1072105 RepID=A0A1G4JRV1_9SACH|nr:LADA_0G02960g1_1 [Lachancea dasiensis]